ncbi:class I SAM-dependent methyltransferase [Lentzea sp. NPDC059081]|uniref:class I SAM-dependent methyltransferase n=1 Tax=Lentzea sp. NPDC059081 TaxID=3346719 RepID=UPI0036B29B8A
MTPSTEQGGLASRSLQAARLIADPARHDYDADLFEQLLSDVWSEGTVCAATAELATLVTELLPTVTSAWRPWLVLALGVFTEGQSADPAVTSAIRAAVQAGYQGYCDLLRDLAPEDGATRAALLYLLSHFPPADGLLEVLISSPLVSTEDATRVARCAEEPVDDARFPLGRCWPSPAHWVLGEHELGVDQEWRANLALSGQHREEIRELETKAVLAFLGGQAEHEAHSADGRVFVVPRMSGPDEIIDDSPFDADADVFCCPRCSSPLDLTESARCAGCDERYEVDGNVVDFLPDAEPRTAGLGQLFLQDPLHVARYESLRHSSVALMAANWTGRIDFEDEHEYLSNHVRPAEGPVLDIACGTGAWTRPLVDLAGAGRVIGVDISRAMVDRFHAAHPDILIARASATALPLQDGSAGAVSSWNALQLFEDPWAALAEMARVLRPGGSLTLLTFRTAERPLQRYFQRRHQEAFDVASFDEEVLTAKLAELGVTVIDTWTPNNYLFVTARRLPLTS